MTGNLRADIEALCEAAEHLREEVRSRRSFMRDHAIAHHGAAPWTDADRAADLVPMGEHQHGAMCRNPEADRLSQIHANALATLDFVADRMDEFAYGELHSVLEDGVLLRDEDGQAKHTGRAILAAHPAEEPNSGTAAVLRRIADEIHSAEWPGIDSGLRGAVNTVIGVIVDGLREEADAHAAHPAEESVVQPITVDGERDATPDEAYSIGYSLGHIAGYREALGIEVSS